MTRLTRYISKAATLLVGIVAGGIIGAVIAAVILPTGDIGGTITEDDSAGTLTIYYKKKGNVYSTASPTEGGGWTITAFDENEATGFNIRIAGTRSEIGTQVPTIEIDNADGIFDMTGWTQTGQTTTYTRTLLPLTRISGTGPQQDTDMMGSDIFSTDQNLNDKEVTEDRTFTIKIKSWA